MTLSNDYNIHTKFNYTDRQIDVTLSAANTGVAALDAGNSELEFIYKVKDLNGKTVQFGRLRRDTSDPLGPVLYNNGSDDYRRFGLTHSVVGLPSVSSAGNTTQQNAKFDFAGGLDRPDDTGSVFVDHFPLHFWASPYKNESFVGAGNTAEYEQRLAFNNPNIPWSTRDEAYVGDTIIIEEGNAVLKGAVATVTDQRTITVTTANTRDSVAYSTQNIAPAILKVTAGPNQGDVFYCSSQNGDELTIDGDVDYLSGERVALMPVRTVAGYTGYSFNSSVYSGNGFNGPTAEFRLNDYIPTDIGSFTFTGNGGWADEGTVSSGAIDWLSVSTTANIGNSNFSATASLFQDYAGISGNTFLIENPSRAGATVDYPLVGSVCKYRGADGSFNTGIVTFADLQSSDVDRPVRIGIYPPVPSATTADTTLDLDIYQPNTFTVLTYPEFDSEYTVEITQGLSRSGGVYVVGDPALVAVLAPAIQPTVQNTQSTNVLSYAYFATGDIYNNTEVSTSYATTVRTPSADIELTANEYESQFTTISETTNFHVGPIHLSNGEILKDEGLGTTKLPAVNLALNVKGGNPKTQSTFVDSNMYMTQTADIMERTNGEYSTAGVGVFTTAQVFNAAQTLICEVTGSYGSAVINKVISLPVQPSV